MHLGKEKDIWDEGILKAGQVPLLGQNLLIVGRTWNN